MAKLSAQEIRDRFGLSYNEQHVGGKADHQNGSNNKTGALYNRHTGEYIGTVNNYARNDEKRKSKDGDGYLREDEGVMGLNRMESYARENGLLTDEISNWNSINDVASMANQILGQDQVETKEPFKPVEKSADHLEAEANYDRHFENGNPWDTTSAVDSYETAFARAVASGRELTAGDYLRQRADDKKGGVNRFTHYLKDSNTLAAHEGHNAAMNAIKKAGYHDLQPPKLIDPGDLYDKYKNDIDDI